MSLQTSLADGIGYVEKHLGQSTRNVTEYHQHKGNP